MFGVKTNSLSVITSWANNFSNLSFTVVLPCYISVSKFPTALTTTRPQLLYFGRSTAARTQLGVWENTTTRASWVTNWTLTMTDVAWRDEFSSHAMSTCAGGFQTWLWAGKVWKAQIQVTSTTTAVGWYNNKHPVRCVWAGRKSV